MATTGLLLRGVLTIRTSISAPSARSVPTKRGKLTAIGSASSITLSPSAASASNTAAMATR